MMPSIFEQVLWVLKKAGRSARKNTEYYICHPKEAWEDLIDYAKEDPTGFAITCTLIVGGVLIIVLPLVIGFGPAGPILGSIAAGWQSGIGAVAAGSLFATLQSLSMTGTFTGVGAMLLRNGVQRSVINGLIRSGPSPWFLHKKYIHRRGFSEASPDTDRIKRVLLTNSKTTYKMVWMDMDSSFSGSVEEYALTRYDVVIHLINGPRVKRGNKGFYEMFDDHMECNQGCQCTGDLDDVDFSS